MITVVTGGIKSGKSLWAQKRGESINGSRAFIATALALDEEMRERIKKHQSERADKWITHEESLNVAPLIEDLAGRFDVVLLDCLTMWVSNLLTVYNLSAELVQEKADELTACLAGEKSHIILVTNEVGMGIIPPDPLSRAFQSLLGRLNREMASVAHEFYMMVSGVPMKIKNSNL
jgi:adenosylcobinamide kinase/adenosylcobinamide-phosphate guanylyltransferase